MQKSNSSKNLNSYYVLTAFGGINLPRFAIFVTFLIIFVKIATPANRAKTRQTRAFQERKQT